MHPRPSFATRSKNASIRTLPFLIVLVGAAIVGRVITGHHWFLGNHSILTAVGLSLLIVGLQLLLEHFLTTQEERARLKGLIRVEQLRNQEKE